MQSRATPKESTSHASRPFFASQPARSSALLSPPHSLIQTKLTMGAPGDRFEREADTVADAIVQRTESRSGSASAVPSVQAKCAKCGHEETLQRQVDAGSTPDS